MNQDVVDFANGILSAIGTAQLTETEAQSLPDTIDPAEAVYSALADIINGRGFPDNAIERLNGYAVSKGIDFRGDKKVFNNIFIGAVLK